MTDRIRNWLSGRAFLFYPVCILVTLVLTFAAGPAWLYMGAAVLLLFAFRPGSAVHRVTVRKMTPRMILCTLLAAAITSAVCILPMGALPIWNGEEPGHRNQYELMAEAILDGRLDFEYGDEESLEGLENPYSPAERREARVYFHWDHAYYRGHYYMYFGIVPVFLVFIPFRLLTGHSLTTYHATQIFTFFIIIGIFALFWMLARLFLRELSFSVYIALSAAFSVMSVWYATAEPALYCTAISSAVALEVWSLYFYIRAVWRERRENRQILLAGIGALLGALAFGCRPTVALTNILVLPMLAVFLKKRRITWKLLGKLVLAALPYVLVGAALMCYNYVRFDNPFEFGQIYQLTVADQSGYRFSLDLQTVLRVLRGTAGNFFARMKLSPSFPYLTAGGVFANYPILLLSLGIFLPSAMRRARRRKLLPLMGWTVITVLVISAFQVIWTPYLLERYHMDIYFLMGILCFIAVGLWHGALQGRGRKWLCSAAVTLSAVTVVTSFLLYVSAIGFYYPWKVGAIARFLRLA